jgi:hypothetical protein
MGKLKSDFFLNILALHVVNSTVLKDYTSVILTMTEHKHGWKVSVEFRIKDISRGTYRGKPFIIGLTNQLHEIKFMRIPQSLSSSLNS